MDPRTEPVETVYLTYHDEISAEKVSSLMAVCSQVVTEYNPQKIYFLFSSGGGLVDSAMTLYNFLKAIPPQIIMHNIGSIDSAANVVFMAGDERLAAPHTSFLFHGVTFGFGGYVGEGQISEGLSIVRESENKIANILATNSDITEAEVRELFARGESKPASFAKTKGIVSRLVEANVPSGAPLFTINFNGNS